MDAHGTRRARKSRVQRFLPKPSIPGVPTSDATHTEPEGRRKLCGTNGPREQAVSRETGERSEGVRWASAKVCIQLEWVFAALARVKRVAMFLRSATATADTPLVIGTRVPSSSGSHTAGLSPATTTISYDSWSRSAPSTPSLCVPANFLSTQFPCVCSLYFHQAICETNQARQCASFRRGFQVQVSSAKQRRGVALTARSSRSRMTGRKSRL